MLVLRKTQFRKLCFYLQDVGSRGRSLFTRPKLLEKKFNVCIEGNIGSGKTAFLQYFKRFDRVVEITEEPVNIWRNFGGENPLATLYADPKRWSFTFQSLVMLTLLRMHIQYQERSVRMMERSLFSSQYCFVENLSQSEHLTAYEYTVLQEWFNTITSSHGLNVDLIVYLQTTPETCFNRIKNRHRPEEQNITLEYLENLHRLHENWLINGDNSKFFKPPVLVIDGNQDKQTMEEKYSQLSPEILFGLGTNLSLSSQ